MGGLRPVLTFPQDCKAQLALEEVTWVGTKAARKAQGQWCPHTRPLPSANVCPAETGSVRERVCPGMRPFTVWYRYLIYKALPAFYMFHNDM